MNDALGAVSDAGSYHASLKAASARLADDAQRIRDMAPDPIKASARVYADLLDQAAQGLGSASALRQVGDAVRLIGTGTTNSDSKDFVAWIETNCQTTDPSLNQSFAVPTDPPPSTVPDHAFDPPSQPQ